MTLLAFVPILLIFTSIGLSYAGVLPAMVGWILCALGVLVGLGVAVTIFFTAWPDLWLFAIIAGWPFAVTVPMVVKDLRYPRINDVTTNVEDPPVFVEARRAPPNVGRDMTFPKRFEAIVREAYPNVQPLVLDERPDQVFERVERLASTQSGWIVTHCDSEKRVLEGEATTSLFRFVDDFVIRVSDHDDKSRVDMRSKSRDGLVDAGANAKRIQAFLARLGANCVSVALMVAVVLTSGCATRSNEPGPSPPHTALDDQPPRIVNAFFGLDDALPMRAAGLCLEAPGADGMPVTFSRRVVGSGSRDAEVSASAFTVITRSGAHKTPACATLAPAIESSERHTVLLVGDLGDATDDPPVRVEVTDSLPLADGADGRGLTVDVTPLERGPTLVLAMGFGVEKLQGDCPPSTKQTVVVVWAGGVRPAEAATDHDHRGIYRVTTAAGDVVPLALGDIDDRDNYVHLCLDTDAPATRVTASGGVLIDPRGDLNPESSLDVVQ